MQWPSITAAFSEVVATLRDAQTCPGWPPVVEDDVLTGLCVVVSHVPTITDRMVAHNTKVPFTAVTQRRVFVEYDEIEYAGLQTVAYFVSSTATTAFMQPAHTCRSPVCPFSELGPIADES